MTRPTRGVGGIVLCGGQSRRMGRPKAWLRWGREYLLQRVVRLVGGVVGPVVAATRAGQSLPPLPGAVEVVFDVVADAGPLAGIASGFEALAGRCEAAFVVACDQPLLRPGLIVRLAELLEHYEAVVPRHEGRLHPTTALYRLQTRAILADMLEARRLRATEFAERCAARIVGEEDFADCDPQLVSLHSFNDPQAYRALMGEEGDKLNSE